MFKEEVTQYCPMCEEWAEKYEKLKAENVEIRKKFGIETLINETTGEKTHRSLEFLKLKQALQEIKEIAEYELNNLTDSAIHGGRYLEILNKIKEVEDENI